MTVYYRSDFKIKKRRRFVGKLLGKGIASSRSVVVENTIESEFSAEVRK